MSDEHTAFRMWRLSRMKWWQVFIELTLPSPPNQSEMEEWMLLMRERDMEKRRLGLL